MNNYVLSKEESQRINIIKYMAIIFVVYIHAYAAEINLTDANNTPLFPEWLIVFENLVSQVITRCGVPLFFLISSILFFKTKRQYGQTIKNKAITLLIPYVIWNSFWILVFIVLQSFSFTAPYFSGDNTPILHSSLFEWFKLYGMGAEYPQNYPLWFMRDLMVVTLIFPIINGIANRFPKQLLIASIVLLFIPTFPFQVALAWFCMGACIVKLQIHLTILDNIPVWKFSTLYALSALITLIARHSITDTLFIFVGVLYWTRISKCIYDSVKTRKLFLALSEWTFMIFVAHELTLTSLKKICFKLLPMDAIWVLIEYIILPVFVIAGCSIAGAIFKKVAPKLYHISTGSR